MTRLKAAGIHLGISACIATVVLAAMLGVWYPEMYFQLMGGSTLLILIVGVDVCLGPLITLVIFKSGKPGLKFDLMVIALIQATALAYGVHVMYASRPAYTVFTTNRFIVAPANEIEPAELEKASRAEWQKLPLFGPEIVFGQLPKDKAESDKLAELVKDGFYVHQLPKYYAPYSENVAEVLKEAKPLAKLRKLSASHNQSVEDFLQKQGKPEQNYAYVPIWARLDFMTVVLDAKTGAVVGMLDVDPYAIEYKKP